MMTLRYRGTNKILEVAKQIDAFPKIPKEYKETTRIGGTLSIFSRILIVIIIYNEVAYYDQSKLVFKFQPDVDLDDKVKLNIDIIVATPCIGISGIDLVDETQQEVFSYGALKRENTWWELTPEQQTYFNDMKHKNQFLREEYHSIAEIIFKDIFHREVSLYDKVPKRRGKLLKPFDACRVHGSLVINKVAGILHIVNGDAPLIGILDNHWHLEGFRRIPYNFTHRIYSLSFGDLSSQLVQPLEGDERYVPLDTTVVQYFIDIVPTEVHTFFGVLNTYQYSVKENFRPVDLKTSSYGLPGIYFKYDWSALKVIVKQDRDDLTRFLVRLSSIISGIVIISGILSRLIQCLHKEILQFLAPHLFKYKKYNHLEEDPENPISELTIKPKLAQNIIFSSNDLIKNANHMNLDAISIKTVPFKN